LIPAAFGTFSALIVKVTFFVVGLVKTSSAPLVGTDALAWPTDRGHLYVASSEGRAIRYRLETKNHFVATPAFLPPDRIVVCSTDGYVYCLHSLRQSGNIMWKYSSGEPISRSPIVVDGVVYVVTDDGKLFALSSDLGQLQWKTPGVRKILSVTKSRIYAVGDVGIMRILDKASGALISSVPLTEFDLQVTNTLSDRLYFGTQTGVIQCLREIGGEWVYRLIQEPRRMWRRYLVGNVVFLWRVVRERLAAPPMAGAKPWTH